MEARSEKQEKLASKIGKQENGGNNQEVRKGRQERKGKRGSIKKGPKNGRQEK